MLKLLKMHNPEYVKVVHMNITCRFTALSLHNIYYYTSREDSLFWLVNGHGLIVMFSSLLSDRLLSLTAYEIIE